MNVPGGTDADGATNASEQQRNVLAAAKGGGFLAGGSFFEFASRFIIALLLARFLGAADYGLYVLALTAAALFSGIAFLGLDDAMVRYVAILSSRRDHAGLTGAMQVGLGASTVAGILMGAVLFLGADLFADRLFDQPRLALMLQIIAVTVPLLTLSNVLAGIARGFRRMDYAAFAENVVQSVVRVGLLVALAFVGRLDLLGAVLTFLVADVAASATLIVLLRREIPLERLFRPGARRDVKEIFKFAMPLWMSGLLRKFRGNVETIVLGALAAASSVGIFSVVDRVTLVGHVFLLAILVAVKPILAELHDRGDRVGLAHVYRTTTRWALILYVPFFLVMVLYPSALLSVFGSAFTAGGTALILLACAEMINAGTGVCGPMIDMTGHVRVKLANSVLFTVLAIGGSAVFIPRWGIVGAALSSMVAISSVNLLSVVEVWYLERFVPFDRTFLKPLAAGGASLLLGGALQTWVPVGTSFSQALLQGTAVVLLYLGLVTVMRLAPEDRLVLGRTVNMGARWVGRGRTAFATVLGRSS